MHFNISDNKAPETIKGLITKSEKILGHALIINTERPRYC